MKKKKKQTNKQKCVLNQQVTGARPAANITWYNNTTPLSNNSRLTIHQKAVSFL